MLSEAIKRLKQKFLPLNEKGFIFLEDADDIFWTEKYDYICAIGLIEYLIDIKKFFTFIV
jgi:hypothetical protein